MALTPNSRTSTAPWNLKVTTPSNSPFLKSPNAKASRHGRNDTGLSLRHVIGTTASSANSIDALSSTRSLAFTAGAAAVIATFDDQLAFTQRFYRARPNATPLNPSPVIYEPSTPTTPSDHLRRRTATPSLQATGTTVSPFGTPGPESNESPGGKTWTARERVKACTCTSLSPDGKYLAVGETGYKPRVLVFSTSKEASPYIPLTSLSDHTFGVKCVAFSPNSQHLASLGNVNDGFLYIWSINNRNGSATLYASNKCTSNIFQMAWVGTNVVTVGTRHVKIWRVEGSSSSTPVKLLASLLTQQTSNSGHNILSGRNCLLGPLLEATFTSIVSISSTKAIVCSEAGDICLLDDSEGRQAFYKLANAGFSVTAISLGVKGTVLLAGKGGVMKSLKIETLLKSKSLEISERSPSVDESCAEPPFMVALAPLGNHVAAIDTNRFIRLIKPPVPDTVGSPEVALQLPAHGGPVLGVRPFTEVKKAGANFFTWSADGTILFWDIDGSCKRTIDVELEQPDNYEETQNELKVVRLCSSGDALVTGDKCGVLRIIDQKRGDCQFSLRAHAGEITDVAVHEQNGQCIIASCGRDRTVQVFHKNGATLELMQTLDEHVGAVTGLLFTSNGSQLISCSNDRNVVVREAFSRTENGKMATAFMILRTITLKATPVSMTLLSDRNDILFVSAIDRNVHKYNLRTGQLSESFKVSDTEGGDAVVLSSLAHVPTNNGQNRIAGVSSTDKSIRLYDENGSLLGRDWGHTEGVTDLTVITSADGESPSRQCTYLVSVAADGTVFIWSFGARSISKRDASRSMELMGVSTSSKELLVNKPPLRRVLSQSEMARFQQKSPEQDPSTPTGKVKSKLERKPSRFSLAQAPKLDPSPITSYDPTGRRKARGRSPSPPVSPKTRTLNRKSSNPAIAVRSRTKSGGGSVEGVNNLTASTEQMCRNLRIYRKKLVTSTDSLSSENLAAVERELGLTLRAVSEKAMKARGAADETVMVKMLSQYSERLLEMLDEKFAATIAKQAQLNGLNNNNRKTSNSAEQERVSTPGEIEDLTPGTSPVKGSHDEDHPTIHEEGEP
ncbi:hypothetical protein Vi05172_g7952 [Venturia inaequalis]|nr:hypothetical protein Vi05172_g7952 [Venturia inaequalis]